MGEVKSYRDLLVWQKAMDLAELAYSLAKLMPKQEEYRLTGQLLRAAVSVPANIAEGHMRFNAQGLRALHRDGTGLVGRGRDFAADCTSYKLARAFAGGTSSIIRRRDWSHAERAPRQALSNPNP